MPNENQKAKQIKSPEETDGAMYPQSDEISTAKVETAESQSDPTLDEESITTSETPPPKQTPADLR